MKLYALLAALVHAQESITCYQCEYSWVVAEVNGNKVTEPIRGSQACRDGSAENGDFGDPIEMQREVEINGLIGRYKCSTVQAKGTETVWYGQGQKYEIEFDVFGKCSTVKFPNSVQLIMSI